MTVTNTSSDFGRSRLDRKALDGWRIHSAGLITVIALAAIALLGHWYSAAAFFAVGAGAGYSLSGSV